MLNHIGQNDRAMRLEMKNAGQLDELKSLISAETLPQIINIVQTKSEFVSGLNLTKAPKEAKLREQYLAKLDDLVNYINENAPKILAQAQAK